MSGSIRNPLAIFTVIGLTLLFLPDVFASSEKERLQRIQDASSLDNPPEDRIIINPGTFTIRSEVSKSGYDSAGDSASFKVITKAEEPILPSNELICDDGIDNDNDGLVDVEDPDCLPAVDPCIENPDLEECESPPPICEDNPDSEECDPLEPEPEPEPEEDNADEGDDEN
jgi:hypothetical protein